MKAFCTTENLKKGILIAEKIIGKNLTLPILSGILLEAEKGRIKISATNLEIGLIAKIRAKIEKEGAIVVPGRIIGSILSQLTEGSKIELEEKNNTLQITYNGNLAVIKGMNKRDFPIIPKPKSEALFELSADEIQKRMGNILSSAAVSEMRQELTGVYFEFGETKLTAAATDSFRLAETRINLVKGKSSDDYKRYLTKTKEVIVPAHTLSEVIRAISLENEFVKVYLTDNQIFFEVTDTLIISRLIDGKYPEYKQVIPKEFSLNVTVKREDLLKAARLAGVFSDSKSREIRLKIKSDKNKLVVYAQSVEAGEGSWSVNCVTDNKKDAEIAFNNRFFLDCLNSLSTEDILISLNDSFGPVMFREISAGKIQPNYFHVIMPIRS